MRFFTRNHLFSLYFYFFIRSSWETIFLFFIPNHLFSPSLYFFIHSSGVTVLRFIPFRRPLQRLQVSCRRVPGAAGADTLPSAGRGLSLDARLRGGSLRASLILLSVRPLAV